MNAIRRFIDYRLGRGEGAITAPTLDGPLLPNQALEQADTVAGLDGADDLAPTEKGLLVSAGTTLYRLPWGGDGAPEAVADYDRPISALAVAKGVVAVGLEGGGVALTGRSGEDIRFGPDQGPTAPTALAFLDARTLLVTEGADGRAATDWRRDLMEKGASGVLWMLDLDSRRSRRVLDGLAWAGGVSVTGSRKVFLSESWRHRILAVNLDDGTTEPVLQHLPAYPARIAPAVGAGYWLSFYSIRNQLVEFILREDEYRRRMLAEVPEPYWMAPSLSSGASFREPMQGSQLKQMGVLKPYAVTRSYGLVVQCDARMRPLTSYHARADGTAHGVVAAREWGDDLYAVSKGSGRVLRLTGVARGI